MTISSNGFCNRQRNFINYNLLLDKPVVISLERHRFRFYETRKLMENVGFSNIQRFNAIDGFYADEMVFKELNILGGSSGQKGCAASHLIIWRNFFQDLEEKDYLFVCEDDMLPHSNFAQLFPFYWSKTPDDFDIIMVGNTLHTFYDAIEKKRMYLISEPTPCAHAYIVSKKGARKLYELYMQLSPTSDPDIFIIDEFLRHMMIDKKIQFYCYDGRFFPDYINQANGKIWKRRNSGICFQNTTLGSSIFTEENLPYNENMYIADFPQNR